MLCFKGKTYLGALNRSLRAYQRLIHTQVAGGQLSACDRRSLVCSLLLILGRKDEIWGGEEKEVARPRFDKMEALLLADI
jgi:hypothetical protein